MPRPNLIDSLPEPVLLVKRDGTPVAYVGGKAVTELGCRTAGEGFVPSWSRSTATLVRQLARKAIADRAAVDTRFRQSEKRYEIRVSPQSPARAICVIRPASDAAIANAILSLARSLDLTVTAEGVEHPGQLEWLRARLPRGPGILAVEASDAGGTRAALSFAARDGGDNREAWLRRISKRAAR